MLSDGEIEKIKKLIDQGNSDYKIGKELKHSPNTVKNIREKYEKTKVSQKNIVEMYYKYPSEKLRDLIKNLKIIIRTEQLKAEEKKELEELLEILQGIIRTEYDERIDEDKTKTIEGRDKQWQDYINLKFIEKEEDNNLNNKIKELETTVENLRNENTDKDNLLRKNQQEISLINISNRREKETLNNRIRNLTWQKADLEEKNRDLNDYIDNYLDDAGRREREKLMQKETDFERNVQIRQSELDNRYFEIEKKQKAVEKREEKVTKREENVRKHQQELDKTLKTISEIKNNLECWQQDIDNQQENIKKRWETVLKTAEEQRTNEQRLQKWQTNLDKTGGFNKFSLPCPDCGKPMLFDITNKETLKKINETFVNYTHCECIKNKQQRRAILRPITYSGEPIIQSGFSPTIQSGGEIMIAKSIAEPIVQSGYPIIQSGEKVKLVVADAKPILQSGFSDSYTSGIGNFNKNSKGSKVSS